MKDTVPDTAHFVNDRQSPRAPQGCRSVSGRAAQPLEEITYELGIIFGSSAMTAFMLAQAPF